MTDDLLLYKIPSDNMGKLDLQFKKLGRRAKKLGLPAPTYTEVKVERIEKKDEITLLTKRVYLLHHILVDAGISEVKVSGWKFIATIQMTDSGNIIRRVGQDEVPTTYRTISNKCEHCNTIRNRKDIFLLLSDAGLYKIVGRSCLQDFFGIDAVSFAEKAQYLADLKSSCEDDEMGSGSSGGPKFDVLEDYLADVAQCIKLTGWMSKGRAKEMVGVQSTSELAYLHFNPAARSPKFVPLYKQLDQDSINLANNAVLWASEIEGEDVPDYLHNIRVIANRGVCEDRDRGMAASIVFAYQRHLGDLHRQELQARRNEVASYVGTVGEKLRLKLYLEKVITCDGMYGISFLHIFSDDSGNVFNWFTSSEPLEVNQKMLIEATVKKQEEYKGCKQNTLTRCKVIEMKSYTCIDQGKFYTVEAVSESEAKKMLRELLGVAKLPRGMNIYEDKIKENDGT